MPIKTIERYIVAKLVVKYDDELIEDEEDIDLQILSPDILPKSIRIPPTFNGTLESGPQDQVTEESFIPVQSDLQFIQFYDLKELTTKMQLEIAEMEVEREDEDMVMAWLRERGFPTDKEVPSP